MQKNIVLLHGWGASSKKLALLKKHLTNKKWNVLNLKMPGFERPVPKEVWGVEDYARDVRKVAFTYFSGQKYFVFGHSFGGRIAIKMAVNKTNKPEGIILCASAGISRGKKLKRAFFNLLAKLGKVLLLAPPLALVFRTVLYRSAGEHDYEKLNGNMRRIFKKVINEDLKDFIPQIKVPVLLLWGESDKMTPITDAKYIFSHLPDLILNKSRIVVFKNQGHLLPYKRPKSLVKEMEKWHRFLA